MKNPSFINPPCPHLPEITNTIPITYPRKYRTACDIRYFNACLELAQSLWRRGSPAQAILQLDKSMMVDSSEEDHINYPYAAILWMIENAPNDQFIGNPVRHFQHLASRINMAQPNAQARIWRAWACLHLAETVAHEIYPRDDRQVEKEGLEIPSVVETLRQIQSLGCAQESLSIKKLLLS